MLFAIAVLFMKLAKATVLQVVVISSMYIAIFAEKNSHIILVIAMVV